MNKELINKSNRSQWLLWSVSLGIFLGICLMVKGKFGPLIQTEQFTTRFLQQQIGRPQMDYQHSFFNDLMTFFANYGDATPLILLTCIVSGLLFFKRYTFLAFWFLGVVATGGIVGAVLKFAYHRVRPIGHLPADDGFSFPSGHAVGSTLFFLVLLLVFVPLIKQTLYRKLAAAAILLIWLGILGSRLYFSAHHLGDLIGGVAFSSFWVLSAMFVYSWTAAWFKKYLFKRSRI